MRYLVLAAPVLPLMACNNPRGSASSDVPGPDFVLSNRQTHDKFSRSIPPAIRAPSGSVIEAHTHQATGGQLSIDSTDEDLGRETVSPRKQVHHVPRLVELQPAALARRLRDVEVRTSPYGRGP